MADRSLCIPFGPVRVRVVVRGDLKGVFQALETWFPVGSDPACVPDLIFELAPPRPGRAEGVTVGRATLSDSTLRVWDGRAWELAVDTADQQTVPRIHLTQRDGLMLRTAGRLPSPLFRFLHVHRFSSEEVRASTFLYRHLIPWVQHILVRRGATLVHAAAVRSKAGGGLLVAGWGGSGKTSGTAALYFGRSEQWSFLSDDLAIVDSDGRAYRSPIPLNVFPYSTSTFPPLHDRVVRGMGFWDRLQWAVRGRVMGRAGVARRIPAPIDPSPAVGTKVELALHLNRGPVDEPRASHWDAASFARMCRTVLHFELRGAVPVYAAASALVPATDAIPAIDRLVEEAEKVLAMGLRTTSCRVLTVPEDAGPRELGTWLESSWSERH